MWARKVEGCGVLIVRMGGGKLRKSVVAISCKPSGENAERGNLVQREPKKREEKVVDDGDK
ncbi:hypothetical protein FRX31_012341 [Thalictrum thalictroides]|uniref:Uncharacterized protein n=1 Tax=Thalictrum thalictroides TaxID=46969 RepID=A0A7J6WL13_THATH|nr:hypothetical protein FRX31_012341 [Thalictrum thalictroides]